MDELLATQPDRGEFDHCTSCPNDEEENASGNDDSGSGAALLGDNDPGESFVVLNGSSVTSQDGPSLHVRLADNESEVVSSASSLSMSLNSRVPVMPVIEQTRTTEMSAARSTDVHRTAVAERCSKESTEVRRTSVAELCSKQEKQLHGDLKMQTATAQTSTSADNALAGTVLERIRLLANENDTLRSTLRHTNDLLRDHLSHEYNRNLRTAAAECPVSDFPLQRVEPQQHSDRQPQADPLRHTDLLRQTDLPRHTD
eukprot:scpid91688/ scgid0411/ 